MTSERRERPAPQPGGGGFGQPVRLLPGEAADDAPEEGIGLCLSGGGYRAMLYHAGSLWRLGEAGLLGRLDRVSSVSGGSIAAAVLALAWPRLGLERGAPERDVLERELVGPLRGIAGRTVDVRAVVRGALAPGSSISEQVARQYRSILFGDATLQDLPDAPRFVINATNLGSKVLWRFSKPYCWDYRVGKVLRPRIALATAVAASSAFPPVLSPAILRFSVSDYEPGTGDGLHEPQFMTRVVLTDGGVYDNLGLETVWKRCRTVLISDGGGQASDEARPRRDWVLGMLRVTQVIDNQVRDLRKRQAVGGLASGHRDGAYWGIRSDVASFPAKSLLPCPHRDTLALAKVPTRLGRLDATTQKRLVNWGYALCDVALRSHVDEKLEPAGEFPYPDAGVGPKA